MATMQRRNETATVWDPFRIMLEMLGEQAQERTYGRSATYAPTFEVFERKDAYVFRGDLPGVKQEDLDITLTENRLTIAGKRDAEERKEGETYYAYERSFGSFTRTFSLPATRARSASRERGRCSSLAVYVMFRAQLVRVSVGMLDVPPRSTSGSCPRPSSTAPATSIDPRARPPFTVEIGCYR